ncbi:MAG: VCBS repeat-containing protein, partial [Gemmatimonadota bacterium]|nr:VCBS repeat-containing protein [Gemmatimonadota bacterium]
GTGHFEMTGTFGDPSWPTRNVTVIDLTGDRRPDIVVANRGGAPRGTANYICPNDGEGYFSTCTELSAQSATTIGAGDLTGDGHIDLVVPHRDGGQSFVYVNDGKGNFEINVPLGPAESATRAIALGDVNGNGRLDIVVGNDQEGGVLLYVNHGDLVFEGPLPLGTPSDLVYSIAIADLDQDDDNDIVLGTVEAPSAVLVNSGDGMSFSVMQFGDSEGAVYGLAIGDVNGDGLPDIVAARSGAPNMLYLNSGS